MNSSVKDCYSTEIINSIIRKASSLLESWQVDTRNYEIPKVIGTLLLNADRADILTVKIALARLGISYVDLSGMIEGSLSRMELSNQICLSENAVDMLITSFHDLENFGNGRSITEEAAKEASRSMISYSDDIYSFQGALGEILGLQGALNSLREKRIAISWIFGSQFSSPNTPHSLLMMLPCFGADLKVVAPPPFSLLNRTRHEADQIATEKGTNIEYISDFNEVSQEVDAILALNWGSLENFQRPERNSVDAVEFRDWYLTQEDIPKDLPVLFVPPVQLDLSTSTEVLSTNLRYNDNWLSRRVAVLMATILYLAEDPKTWYLI